MEKKNIILISIIAVVVIAGAILMFSGNKNGWSSDSGNGLADITLTEKEKYANFEAEFACQLLGANEGSDMMTILGGFEALATKHGYGAEDIQKNAGLYDNDNEFKIIAFESMKRQCPAKVEAAGLNEFVPTA
ncbi:MAG: hypothetical protein AABX17_00925 [Nanoarchaeota archaeon]